MWMARMESASAVRSIDFAAARDEGIAHLDDIAAGYEAQLGLTREEIREYLTNNIAFTMDDEMKKGMDLFFELARKHSG
jgi:chorismate dehydratase